MKKKPGPRIKAWVNRIRNEDSVNGTAGLISVPSTTDGEVISCLVELFLGEGWYAEGGWTSAAQVNTLILDEIVRKYCKKI